MAARYFLFHRRYSIVHDLIISCITCPELNKTASVIESPDISEAAEILLTGMHRKKKDKTRKSLHDIEVLALIFTTGMLVQNFVNLNLS